MLVSFYELDTFFPGGGGGGTGAGGGIAVPFTESLVFLLFDEFAVLDELDALYVLL